MKIKIRFKITQLNRILKIKHEILGSAFFLLYEKIPTNLNKNNDKIC